MWRRFSSNFHRCRSYFGGDQSLTHRQKPQISLITRDFVSDKNVFQLASWSHAWIVVTDSQRSQNTQILLTKLQLERTARNGQYPSVTQRACTIGFKSKSRISMVQRAEENIAVCKASCVSLNLQITIIFSQIQAGQLTFKWVVFIYINRIKKSHTLKELSNNQYFRTHTRPPKKSPSQHR